ncbi:Anoctamin-6 [Kappamyces sp. JEL0680]|nr:Anoctamin-6 [Kappamyces sp. JEL0680]
MEFVPKARKSTDIERGQNVQESSSSSESDDSNSKTSSQARSQVRRLISFWDKQKEIDQEQLNRKLKNEKESANDFSLALSAVDNNESDGALQDEPTADDAKERATYGERQSQHLYLHDVPILDQLTAKGTVWRSVNYSHVPPATENPVLQEIAELGFGQNVLMRVSSTNRVVFFHELADALLFDYVLRWKADHPAASVVSCFYTFSHHKSSDAIIKIIYSNKASPFDAILKYDKTASANPVIISLFNQLRGKDSELESCPSIRGRHLTKFLKRGLIIEWEAVDIDANERYLKIIAPFEVIANEAEKAKYKFSLRTAFTDKYLRKGTSMYQSAELYMGDLPVRETPQLIDKPYHSARFERAKIKDFVCGDLPLHLLKLYFFDASIRNQIVFGIMLEAKISLYGNAGHQSSLESLIARNVYDTTYAVHDGPLQWQEQFPLYSVMFRPGRSRAELFQLCKKSMTLQHWFSFRLDLRDYLGDEQGYLFEFSYFSCDWFRYLGLIGLLFFSLGCWKAYTNPDNIQDPIARAFLIIDNEWTVWYSILSSVWSILFLKYWRRRFHELAFRWDVFGLQKKEPVRADWRPTVVRVSPITGKRENHVPFVSRVIRSCVVNSLLIFSAFLVISSITALLSLQNILINLITSTPQLQTVTEIGSKVLVNPTSIATAVATACFTVMQILLFRPAYKAAVVKLNRLHNYRTNAEFEKGLIYKSFLLSFFNTYSYLIYNAILKPLFSFLDREFSFLNIRNDVCTITHNKDGTTPSCASTLAIDIFTIFALRLLFRQLGAVLYPKWLAIRETLFGHKNAKSSTPPLEYIQDGALWPCDTQVLTFDFSSQLTVLGFVSMFAAINPLGAVVAWVLNTTETKILAYQRLKYYRRPRVQLAKAVSSSWDWLISVVVFLSLFTNAMICAFVSSSFSQFIDDLLRMLDVPVERSEQTMARIVFVLLYVLLGFAFGWIVDVLIPSVPKKVLNGRKSEHHIQEIRDSNKHFKSLRSHRE